MNMRIPKRVVLPFGYIITVKQVTREWMNKSLDGEESSDGWWDKDARTIAIVCDDLNIAHQRYVLAHELGHAWNDWMDSMLDTWTISDRTVPKLVHEDKPQCKSANNSPPD